MSSIFTSLLTLSTKAILNQFWFRWSLEDYMPMCLLDCCIFSPTLFYTRGLKGYGCILWLILLFRINHEYSLAYYLFIYPRLSSFQARKKVFANCLPCSFLAAVSSWKSIKIVFSTTENTLVLMSLSGPFNVIQSSTIVK